MGDGAIDTLGHANADQIGHKKRQKKQHKGAGTRSIYGRRAGTMMIRVRIFRRC